MPQRNSSVALSEPASLRRSPRLLQLTKSNAPPQASITPKPKSRSNGALLLLCPTPQISSAARCFPTEIPLICALAASNASDSAPSSCKRSRSGTKKECDLINGVVGIQCVRRSPRFLGRSNLGDLVGATCVGNNNKPIVGGFDGGLVFSEMGEMRKRGRGHIKLRSGPCGKKLGEMNKSGQLSFVHSPVTPFEAGEGMVRNREMGDVKMMGKVSCNYVNGESKKRLRCSSLTDSGVEFNEEEEGYASGVVGNDNEDYVSGKADAGESGISQCYAASTGLTSARGRESDCSTNKERGVVKIRAVRRSPRLLGRINPQKAVSETCYVNSNLSTGCSLNYGQVAQMESKALERKLLMDVNGEKGEGLDAGESLTGGTGGSAQCSDAGLANIQEVRKKKISDVDEKQGKDKACCVSTNKERGVVKIQAVRRSPRLLGRINPQKAVSETCYVNSNLSTSCRLNYGQVAQMGSKAFEQKVLMDVNGEKGVGPDAGESLTGGTGRSAQCSDAGLANIQEVRKKNVSDVKEKQGKDKAFCVSTHLYATPTGKMNMQKTAKQLNAIGGKMKRKQVEGSHQGWTKEQIYALQRAYFATKPTPHFWKNVAKVVPGKSAQDCFDKVNSENMTPPLRQPRSRAKMKISSPSCHFSYSPCRLFRFIEPKNKQVCNGKRKSHLAQRRARHLLEKYSQVCQGNEADLFSVLEPNAKPSVQQAAPFVKPMQMLENNGSSLLWGQRSTSSHPKRLSRFSTSCGNPLISPPVLKPVKNRVLHEKYIDQLHCREAKRMATSARDVKGRSTKCKGKESCLGNGDIIRAAKNALVSDARDAINRFQHLQVDLTETYPELGEDCCYDEEEEEEEEGETVP